MQVDDGGGKDNPLNLIVEIKGYRREDAKEKKSTMDTYWIPGVNHLGTHGQAGPLPSLATCTKCRTTSPKRSRRSSTK